MAEGTGSGRPAPRLRRGARFEKHHRIWLPVLSVCAAIGFAELGCRLFRLAPPKDPEFRFYIRTMDNDLEYPFVQDDPQLMWALRPGSAGVGPNGEGRIEINSDGFRDRERAVEKPPGAFRILCLGDSCTFGYGTPIEKTYHRLLEQELNRRGKPKGVAYEVINAGVTGYTSAQCLIQYKHKACKYQPDLVTLFAGHNDLTRKYHYDDREMLAKNRPRRLNRIDRLLAGFHSYRALRGVLRAAAGGIGRRGQPLAPRCSLDDFRGNIVELKESCAAHGARLVLMSLTSCRQFVSFDADADADVSKYRRALEEVALDHRIPAFTVPELTERTAAPTAHLFLDKCHPNADGHLLIAKRLLTFLEASGLLPPSP